MSINKIIKKISIVITVILLAIVLFFFWASSENYTKQYYSKLIKKDYPVSMNKDSVYSIITYNIGYLSGMTNNLPVPKPKGLFEKNLSTVYQEFGKVDADMICFQEIDYHSKRSYYVNQQEVLQNPGYNYVYQAVNWDKKYVPFPYFPLSVQFGEILSGQSILSKYPIQDPERIVLNRVKNNPFYYDAFYLDRLAQVCKFAIDGKIVVIVNVHLEAFDEETRTNHANTVADLYNKYKDDYPVLLVGDFNSDVAFENAAIKTIFRLEGIKSAVDLNQKTFPSASPTHRIDYIFYNEGFIELVSAKILTSVGEASDHLPLMMKFSLK